MSITSFIKSLRPSHREHWMILAILIYSLNGVLKYYIPQSLCNALMVLSALIFIGVILRHMSGFRVKGWTGLFYGVLILWSVWLTFHMFFIADVRSTFIVYNGLTTWMLAYFGSPMFLPNLVPFAILAFPRNYQFDFKYLWRIMWLLCILYVCYYPFAFWNMTHYTWSFDSGGSTWGEEGTYGDFITNSTIGITSLAPVVIMVYFKKYLRPKHWRLFLAAYIGSILLQSFLARRGGLVMSILYLVMGWGMYLMNDKKTSKVKMVLLVAVVVALGYMLFTNMADSFFATLVERGVEDSRSGVEESFYADMKTQSDWFFGRGWFGQYYEPGFNTFRSSIETGYLALILRGGFLYLIPYVAVLALSAVNGYFRSRNLFCKSLAIMCLMQIVYLYPFGWPAFNFIHFVIWIGVWVCNRPQIRKLTDEQIYSTVFK